MASMRVINAEKRHEVHTSDLDVCTKRRVRNLQFGGQGAMRGDQEYGRTAHPAAIQAYNVRLYIIYIQQPA